MTLDAEPARAVRDVVDYELLFDCVHCGLCLESCPTYVVTRAEMDSPRGRIYLMKALADGTLELDNDAVRHLDLCLECRGCETACPSGVHYGKLIEKARVYVEHNYRRSFGERLRNRMVGAIFPLSAPSACLAGAAGNGRADGPAAADRAARAGIAARMAPPAAAAQPDGSGQLAAIYARLSCGVAPHPAVVHHGCVAQVLTPSENCNTERALAAAGYKILQLDRTVCCGALDLHNGNRERARELARGQRARLR